MSSPASLVPFVVGSVLVPGPDVALITRQVLAYGQRVARATIASNVAGLVVHTASRSDCPPSCWARRASSKS